MTEFRNDPQEQAAASQPYVYQPPPRRPGWATAIGVISIVWASMTLLCNVVSQAREMEQPEWLDSLPQWMGTYQAVSTVVGLLAAIILLVGGIQLLKRRRSGRTCCLLYSGINLVTTAIGVIILVIWLLPAMREQMVPGGPYEIALIVGISAGIAIPTGWPLFLIVWFNLPGIRRQMEQW